MSCQGKTWRVRDGYRACEYCGSMHPDDLFAAIEAGAMVTGTDKNYKIYVEPAHPDPEGLRVISACRDESGMWGDRSKWFPASEIDPELRRGWGSSHKWFMLDHNGPTAHAKFYFYHFDEEHMQRFIDLFNARKINLEPQFGLYVWPFFMRPKPKTD